MSALGYALLCGLLFWAVVIMLIVAKGFAG